MDVHTNHPGEKMKNIDKSQMLLFSNAEPIDVETIPTRDESGIENIKINNMSVKEYAKHHDAVWKDAHAIDRKNMQQELRQKLEQLALKHTGTKNNMYKHIINKIAYAVIGKMSSDECKLDNIAIRGAEIVDKALKSMKSDDNMPTIEEFLGLIGPKSDRLGKEEPGAEVTTFINQLCDMTGYPKKDQAGANKASMKHPCISRPQPTIVHVREEGKVIESIRGFLKGCNMRTFLSSIVFSGHGAIQNNLSQLVLQDDSVPKVYMPMSDLIKNVAHEVNKLHQGQTEPHLPFQTEIIFAQCNSYEWGKLDEKTMTNLNNMRISIVTLTLEDEKSTWTFVDRENPSLAYNMQLKDLGEKVISERLQDSQLPSYDMKNIDTSLKCSNNNNPI